MSLRWGSSDAYASDSTDGPHSQRGANRTSLSPVEHLHHEEESPSIDHISQHPPSPRVRRRKRRRERSSLTAVSTSKAAQSNAAPTASASSESDMINPTRLGPIEPPPPPPPRLTAWGWVLIASIGLVAFIAGWAAALFTR